jgi:hypothetical protein
MKNKNKKSCNKEVIKIKTKKRKKRQSLSNDSQAATVSTANL